MKKAHKFKTAIVAAAAMFVASVGAAVAEYPDRAIKLIVGSVPGSGPDVLARSMSEELSQELGQPIIVENKPGAGGNVAAAALTRGTPDGYEIYIGTVNMTMVTWMAKDPPFDPATDFAFIGRVAAIPNVIVVKPDLGVSTVEELVAMAKSKPGELNYSSAGTGTPQHLGTDAMAKMNDLDIEHIAYKGGANATKAVLAGEVEFFLAGIPPAIPHIKSGALVALAVSSEKEFPLLPGVPTLNETVMPGYVFDAWYGLFMTKGTPEDIVAKVNAAANKVLADPKVIERFNNAGAAITTSTPNEFAGFVAAESDRWKNNLDELGLLGTR